MLSSGHPLYWDPVTDSGWTSYQVGQQWHETFFEDPPSLYDSAELAQSHNFAGVGIWALGMDGNDADNLTALDGFAPVLHGLPAGPASTSASPPATASPAPSASSPTPPSHTPTPPAAPTTTTTRPQGTTTTTRPPGTTTTTVPQHGGDPYTYTGDWDLSPVTLSEVSGTAIPPQGGAPAGQLQDFATNDPAAACLAQDPPLTVWPVSGSPNEYLVVATSPADCIDADFEFRPRHSPPVAIERAWPDGSSHTGTISPADGPTTDPVTGDRAGDGGQADTDLRPSRDDPLRDDALRDDSLRDDPVSDDPLSDDPLSDDDAMGLALEQARAAAAAGEVPVGAVALRNGRVVSARHNEREATGDPTAHAEMLALRDAGTGVGGWRLNGVTLVVTLEPCPMCAGALVAGRVDRLVFGASDPRAGACGSLYNLCVDPRFNHELELTSGVRAEECADVLTSFFSSKRRSEESPAPFGTGPSD